MRFLPFTRRSHNKRIAQAIVLGARLMELAGPIREPLQALPEPEISDLQRKINILEAENLRLRQMIRRAGGEPGMVSYTR